jgi:hypothetical protein
MLAAGSTRSLPQRSYGSRLADRSCSPSSDPPLSGCDTCQLLALALLTISLSLIGLGACLLWQASLSTLALFLFPSWLLAADALHALTHLYLQVDLTPTRPSSEPYRRVG